MLVQRKLLRAKIHGAHITHADADYEGSLTLPPNLMEAANIIEYEEVHVWNVTRGTRLQTYAIKGSPNAKDISANGAAAHLLRPGDKVIIACFIYIMGDKEIESHIPKIIFLTKENEIKSQRPEKPGPLKT